jgi:hypothetical protein
MLSRFLLIGGLMVGVAGLAAAGCMGQVFLPGQEPQCGDGVCDSGESRSLCPQDCDLRGPACGPGRECAFGERCVDGTCTQVPGEGISNVICGDDICDEGEPATCPDDCPGEQNPEDVVCGDLSCDFGENVMSCPVDCLEAGELPEVCRPLCLEEAQCEDGDPCTVDRCMSGPPVCGTLRVCTRQTLACPPGQHCVSGVCRLELFCGADEDCEMGQRCVDGLCAVGP